METIPNPAVLRWARERLNLSVEELSHLVGKDPETIIKWEAGEDAPSYSALESLAYRHLKVPIAVFFFPEPPEGCDPVGEFRRLPDSELERLSPNTLHLVNRGVAYQDSLIEFLGPVGSKRRIFDDLDRSVGALALARRTREYLGISVEDQFGFQDCEQAFKAWRHALEMAGVFTFKDTMKDEFISGFCLLHHAYPIIFVNNSNAHPRQVFTLAHELGHIMVGIQGVTDINEAYIGAMSGPERRREIACNAFAAEVLVPEQVFRRELGLLRVEGISAIGTLADKYSVSREVILRRCRDFGIISDEDYSAKVEEFMLDYRRGRRPSSGGNYYLTKLAYLGEGFTSIAFDLYRRGRISKTDLAGHLNMNGLYIDRLQQHLG